MADTVYHLLATRNNIPSDWINDFDRSGFYRIKFRETKKGERSREDFMYLWDIWFVVLFTWNETDYPDIKKILVTVQTGERLEYEMEMSENFSNSCFQQFKKGYLEGLKSFEVEVKQAIGIFKKSDKNKREAILKLKDQWRKQILFSGSFYPEKLERIGKYNALFTMAAHLVEEHGLEAKEKREGERHLGEFEKILKNKNKFIQYEDILIDKGYFSKGEVKELHLEKHLLDLAAWVVFIQRKNLIDHIRKPSKSQEDFNFSKFAENYINERYEGFNLKTLKNKISPSRFNEIKENYKNLEKILSK